MPVSLYFQPETALDIGAAGRDDTRIAQDLAALLATLGPIPAKPPKVVQILRLVQYAIRRWTLIESRLSDALRITNAVPPGLHNHPIIVTLRCRILRLLDDFPGCLREIERQCARPDLALAELEGLVLFCERNGMMPVLSRAALAVLGLEHPIVGDPRAWYCDPTPRPDDTPRPIDEAALAVYCQMSGRAPTAELQARLEVAETLFSRVPKMNIWYYSVQRMGEQATAGFRHAHEIRDAVDLARISIVRADLGPVQRAIEEGRNVIVMMAHIGSGVVNLALQDIEASRVFIARGDTVRPGFEVLTTGDTANIGMKMLRLAKAMKLRRHLLLVAPDGPSGLDFARIELGGVPMWIGVGAAALARVHDSTLFFARSVWCRDHFKLELIEGPQINKGMEKLAANAAFVEMFTKGMHNALQGAPEDFCIGTFLKTRAAGPTDIEK